MFKKVLSIFIPCAFTISPIVAHAGFCDFCNDYYSSNKLSQEVDKLGKAIKVLYKSVIEFVNNNLDASIIKKYQNSKFPRVSKYFVLDNIEDSYFEGYITPENLKKWLDHLDTAYETYADLVGSVPSDGRKIIIEGIPGVNYLAAALYSEKDHSKILWNKDAFWISGELRKINRTGTESFAIWHELGHLFDLENRWTFDSEFFANLKQSYLYNALNAKMIYLDEQYGTWYSGKNITKHFCSNDDLEKTPPVYSDNSLICKTIGLISALPDKWEALKDVFRYILSLNKASVPASISGRFNLFWKTFSRRIGFDALSAILTTESQKKVVNDRFNSTTY